MRSGPGQRQLGGIPLKALLRRARQENPGAGPPFSEPSLEEANVSCTKFMIPVRRVQHADRPYNLLALGVEDSAMRTVSTHSSSDAGLKILPGRCLVPSPLVMFILSVS